MPKFEMNIARRHNSDGAAYQDHLARSVTVFDGFRTVYQPYIHRLLTVIHRFLPFLPFSKTVRELDQRC